MTLSETGPQRVLSVVVCGAGPAAAITTPVKLALDRGWVVQVISTPAALDFFAPAAVEDMTGNPVRSQYGKPGAPRSHIPDAIVVAPATYNTICKWGHGTSDTYALGVLAEQTGMGLPIVVLPFVNAALANSGGSLVDSYPWHLALDEADSMTAAQDDRG